VYHSKFYGTSSLYRNKFILSSTAVLGRECHDDAWSAEITAVEIDLPLAQHALKRRSTFLTPRSSGENSRRKLQNVMTDSTAANSGKAFL
jgi:hypothetical protein